MARISRTTLLSATFLMGLAATPAFAQDAAPGETATSGSNNEIVVTGSRRRTTLQDAPINIAAVGSEQITRQRIDDVKGLAAFTPGVTVADTGPSSAGKIVLRGISS